jgi:hypothetical protein
VFRLLVGLSLLFAAPVGADELPDEPPNLKRKATRKAWRTQDEPVRLGPLPARVRNPVYIVQLQPGFDRALVTPPGRMEVSFEMDWANIFDKWSRNVYGGRNRGRFDLEIIRPSAQVRIGLKGGVELGLEIPLVALVGGIGDPIIQGWHGLFGLENGGREDVENGTFTYDIGIPFIQEHRIRRATQMRLGDISTHVRVQVLRPTYGRLGLVLGGGLKAPTGSEEQGTGSGAMDGYFLATAEHGLGPFAFYGQVGVTVFGRTGLLGPLLAPVAVTGGVAIELIVTPHWSIVVQLRGSTPFHMGFIHPWLNRGPLGISFGARWRIGALDLALGTEQDLNGSDPSSDIAVVFRASVTTP